MGRFGAALRRADATGGPASFRGGPVSTRDDDVRAAIRDLGADGTVDGDAATAAWEEVLRLPQWDGEPVWIHSDLLPGTLLVREGKLSSVIDFGGLGVGDPACDMMVAWTLFSAETRGLFREVSDVDDVTWARGRGWALCFGLMAEHYYRVKNPILAGVGRRAMFEALADYQCEDRRLLLVRPLSGRRCQNPLPEHCHGRARRCPPASTPQAITTVIITVVIY
ncbi:hypothetical protein Misp02_15820 [Microtetraspora sp. NBRC 16547]|nr:hypothetical protein Misp02_15820 [Microtetraspora sp. NBRC 16547]